MNEETVINIPRDEIEVIPTDDLLFRAEKRVNQVQKLISLSLRSTNHQDWVDQNGKPYLMSTGAEKVARIFGVKIHGVETRKINSEDEKGRFYFYQTTGIAELPGGVDSIVAMGTCSSKDQFFALMTVESKDEEGKTKKEKVLKPFSEIDETNIMKSSYTNFLVNAITRLIGLRGLTYDQLKDAGIDVGKISSVRYQGSEMSQEAKGLKDQCWETIKSICNNDETMAKAKLRELTGFKSKNGDVVPGKDNINFLSEKQIQILHGKLKELAPKEHQAKKEGKEAVDGKEGAKTGNSEPNGAKDHIKFMSLMQEFLKSVGTEAYFKCLGQFGYESETGIFDRPTQIKVFEAMSKLPAVK